jgi:glycosyltransferase involved in cell wall biosynthesis
MNVLLINKFYYLRGGAERSFFETQRILQAGGHQVIPFAMRDERNRPTPYARYFVDHVEFNEPHDWREKLGMVPRVIYFRQARRQLESLLRHHRVDLAHVHNIAHQLSPSILDSLKKFGIPVVQTLHDYKLICPTYTLLAQDRLCQRCVGGHYYRAVSQRCNKGSLSATALNVVEMYAHRALGIYRRGIDLLISPSLFLRRKLQEGGVRWKPIVLLPNAIDVAAYPPRAGGQGDVVYFGRFSPEKGLDTLIRAMAGLRGLRLRLVGDGLQRQQLQVLAQREGLADVEFLSPLYGEDLHRVVGNASFVVLPSRCYENCPFSILESFALGKPVIGSNLGGIPELITDGQDGLLFQPGDVRDLREKIRQLADDPARAIQMGFNARAKVERGYHLEAHYQGLMRAYARALRQSSSARWEPSDSSRCGGERHEGRRALSACSQRALV